MNTLHFVATGDKFNSYRAILNGNDVDSCDINSKDCVTQAHIVIRSAQDTLNTKDIKITFDDSKAIHPNTKYPLDKLLGMADFAHYTGMTRIYSGFCKLCGYGKNNHNSLCPENIINSDSFSYRAIQF